MFLEVHIDIQSKIIIVNRQDLQIGPKLVKLFTAVTIILLSLSVCPYPTYPAESIVCGKD